MLELSIKQLTLKQLKVDPWRKELQRFVPLTHLIPSISSQEVQSLSMPVVLTANLSPTSRVRGALPPLIQQYSKQPLLKLWKRHLWRRSLRRVLTSKSTSFS